MNYRAEITLLRSVLSQFATCEANPCNCCSICREGVSKGGYTFHQAHKELHELLSR